MKKNNLFLGLSIFTVNIFAQQNPTNNSPSAPGQSGIHDKAFWSRAGNSGIGPNNSNNIFGTLWNSPIYTRTDGTQRMVLMGTNPAGSISGALGLGTTQPQSYLHLNSFGTNNSNGFLYRTDGNSNVQNQWQFFTGATGNTTTEKFKLFIPANSLDAGFQSTKGEMFFNTATTNGSAPGAIAERMRLTYGLGGNFSGSTGWNTTNGVTKVLISHDGFGANYLPPAVAMLNIGSSTPNPSAGSRPWMDVGTYYSMHTENMYVGLKDVGGKNNTHAVINWGDDPAGTASNDRLLFNFTGFGSQGQSSSIDGLEIGRMWGSANAGRMGIGGDPTINKYFGNSDDPNNTLEINSPVVTFAPNTVGTSGLRFTDLRATSTPITNPGSGVLSVDAYGDVILVPGGGAVTANNGILVNAAGEIQLGGACNNLGEILASRLQSNRTLLIGGHNLWFGSLANANGGIGFGAMPSSSGFCNIANTVEISANAAGKYGSASASGLRLSKLLSTSPTIPNGTNGVNSAKLLTVDEDGDVVLTDMPVGTSIGNVCGSTTPNFLTGNYEIPLGQYNYYFTGQGKTITNIGMGLPCSSPILFAKLQVRQAIANDTWNTGISIAGQFDNVAPGSMAFGIYGSATGNCNTNVGVYGYAANGVTNLAGYFQGDVFTTGGSTSGSGYLVASDKNIKTDVNRLNKNLEIISKLRPVDYKYDNTYAPQLTLNNHRNYGFIAQEVESVVPGLVTTSTIMATYDSLGNVINPEKAISALNYDGLIPFAIGGIQELNAKQTEMQANLDKLNLSDAQVKTNVNNFTALTKVKSLNPVSYNFTNANVPQLNFKNNLDYGFVAQQLETVYPELVDTIRVEATYDSAGVVVNPSKVLKSVNYKAMSALLVRSIQEQQLTIDSLRSAHSKQDSINQSVQQQLAALASQINSCCSAGSNSRNGNSNLNQLDIELTDKDAIVLNQNVPNPFAEQTTITYNVPSSVEKAQLLFFNANGQVIQTVDIKTRGKGKVNVFASDLSSGLYHYTLVADGKVVDSKKMVRE